MTGVGDGPDELLDIGSRRRRWPGRALLLLVVAAATAALVAHALTTGSATPHRATAPQRAVGPPISPRVSDAVDIALAAGRMYIVRASGFTVLDAATGRVIASVRVPELTDHPAGQTYRAVVDEPAGRVWLVAEGGVVPATAVEFDAKSFARLTTVQLPGTVQSAAVLDGLVYLATADGVRELRPGSDTARPLEGTDGFVGYLAADPARHRLLIMNAGFPTRLIAERPDGRDRAETSLPFGAGQVVATRAAIWAIGSGTSGARIVRLDPATLVRTAAADVLASMLHADAVLAGSGSRVVWVRGGDDVWCMDATTGLPRQHFRALTGPLASEHGPAPRGVLAYVAPGGVLSPLRLDGCAG